MTYQYNDAAHKHAVTSAGAQVYGYDANGNMTTRNGDVLSYDVENRLTSITVGASTTTYVYDGDGNRVKKTVGATTTYYVGNHYEVTNNVATKYYYFGKQRVAMRVGTNPVTYLHSDHLGSTSATSGASVSAQTYYAFGNIRSTTGTMPTDYGFTGQRRDASAGLLFYNARYYDPTIGRFISADTMVPSAGNPQSLNRYAYVYNNPVRYTDPSGHCTGDMNNPDDPDAQCWELYRSATSRLGFWATPDDLGAWDADALSDLVRWLDAGVRFTSDIALHNGWTSANLHDVLDALGLVNNRIGDSTRAALGLVNNGTLTFIKSSNIVQACGAGHDGCTEGHQQVWLKLTVNGNKDQRNLVIHELGHVVDWQAGKGQFRSANSESWLTAGGWRWVRDEGWETYGFRGAARVYGLQNPLEDFAETFTWSVLTQNGESYFDNGLNLLGTPNPGRQQELNVMLGEFQ